MIDSIQTEISWNERVRDVTKGCLGLWILIKLRR